VVQQGKDAPLLVTKGAPEAILAASASVREDHTARAIGKAEHVRLAKLVDGASADGFRLIAVASRKLTAAELAALPKTTAGAEAGSAPVLAAGLKHAPSLERNLTFEGVILFSDPPKPKVDEAIKALGQEGIALKIITGDNDLVARHVAGLVGLEVEGVLTGAQMRKLTHPALVARARKTTIFARVDPDQKLQVIRALRESGQVVGYMGDGINDAPALHVADVGISVDNATDVARSAADIILLEPSLAAIAQGVIEGRRTFANTLKYIRMGTSSNFGNMLSMAGAALLLPFLPMSPGQILLNNLIYDASQTAIPSDNVDADVEALPARWDIHAVERFMVVFGPISSVFDYVTFGLLLLMLGNNEDSFHSGWFVESLFTQILVVLAIRTHLSPFWRSRPSKQLGFAMVAALAAAVIIPLSPLGSVIGFGALPWQFFVLLVVIVAAYLLLVEVTKRWFFRREARRAESIAPALR
jgi:Mg2+-importing ATPase